MCPPSTEANQQEEEEGRGHNIKRARIVRTNCCLHGTAFDFNDNALPYAIAIFLKIIDDRFLIKTGEELGTRLVHTGQVLRLKGI